jgi:site-specific DNA-methyltransferase (cytosine-N4-specific)
MPIDLPKFFIKFLTDENDMVLDPFAGSNTTGAAAESLSRKWISIESTEEYIKGSIGRFPKNVVRQVELKELTDV